jgi:hypothetical protein
MVDFMLWLKTFDLWFFLGFLVGLILTVIVSYYWRFIYYHREIFYIENAKEEACGILTRNRCAREALDFLVPGLDIYPRNGILDRDDNGAEHTVQEVCNVYLHEDPAIGTEEECLSACGCA